MQQLEDSLQKLPIATCTTFKEYGCANTPDSILERGTQLCKSSRFNSRKERGCANPPDSIPKWKRLCKSSRFNSRKAQGESAVSHSLKQPHRQIPKSVLPSCWPILWKDWFAFKSNYLWSYLASNPRQHANRAEEYLHTTRLLEKGKDVGRCKGVFASKI